MRKVKGKGKDRWAEGEGTEGTAGKVYRKLMKSPTGSAPETECRRQRARKRPAECDAEARQARARRMANVRRSFVDGCRRICVIDVLRRAKQRSLDRTGFLRRSLTAGTSGVVAIRLSQRDTSAAGYQISAWRTRLRRARPSHRLTASVSPG